MENAKLVAWGIVLSLGLTILTGLEFFGEDAYTLAGLGFFFFGVWASVILFNNAPKK